MPAATPGPNAPRGHEHQLEGIAFVLAAVACFSGIDAATKSVSMVPVGLVLWCRFTFQAGITAAVLLPRRGRALFATRHPKLQFLRGLLMLLTSMFAFLSLRFMPVGEFTAIVMLTPLVMTLIAAFALSEPVSRLRWALIIAAFVGALLVVKPGTDAFQWTTLLPLCTLALNTGFHLVTSRLAKVDDVGTMHFFTGLVAAVLATFALPFVPIAIHSWHIWAGIALVCLFSASGHAMLIIGYSKADVSTLTPLLYTQTVFGTILGWLVFSHIPDRWSLIGIVVIAASGAGSTWLSALQWKRSLPPQSLSSR